MEIAITTDGGREQINNHIRNAKHPPFPCPPPIPRFPPMDLGDFRSLLRRTGADLWDLLDAAVAVAARDHAHQLRARRDGIVERLYAAPPVDAGGRAEEGDERKGGTSPSTPQSVNREEAEDAEEEEHEAPVRYRRSHNQRGNQEPEDDEEEVEDELTKILAIKELIEDPDQDEDTVVSVLQNLADMDITIKALQGTDIGRLVNNLRKHPSGEVRRLVKLLVRKWKDLVDDWVKLNANEASAASIIADGDSPQQIPVRSNQNGYHVSELGHSPNPHNGNSIHDRHTWESEPKPKVTPVPRTIPTPLIKQKPPAPPLSSAPPKAKEPQKESLMDPERLASARRRLQENYQEAQNAKKQRTIQVMDIHEIPKKKNVFFPKSKPQGKHW